MQTADSTRMETKTRAATVTAFVLALIVNTAMAMTTTDYVRAMPDWLEVLMIAIAEAGAVAGIAYATPHQPGRLSQSAEDAMNRQIERRSDLP